MGIVEAIWGHVTPATTAGFLVFAWVAWVVIWRIDENRRLARLGKLGHVRKSRIPLGFDFIASAVKATRDRDNLRYWRDEIMGESWTSSTRILNQRIVFTADPENIKAMLATQFSDFGKGEPFHKEWKDFLGDSIFTTDGAQWHNSRQLIRPQFTRDRVSDLHCFESHIQTLFRAIANGGPLNGEDQHVDFEKGNGQAIDISDLFFRYTLDVTTSFLLGNDVKSLTSPRNEFAEGFNDVQHIQNLVVRFGKLRPFIPKAALWAGLKVVNGFINRYIDQALRLPPEELTKFSKSDKDYTFLHELARFTRDPKIIRDQIVAILLAGRDTTASTLSWTVYELARHPEALAKLRTEIIETVGRERTPTYDDLKNMSYLKAVLNETLRLYPSVPFNVRLALKDTTLPRGGGPDGSEPLPVLKDTPCGYSTLVMQRRKDLYPPISEKFADPDIFSPDRWAHWHPKPHEYIPFNAGPRICIGQQFALTEMSYVLCRLFQRYGRIMNHMNEIDGGNPSLKADIVLSPGQGVRVSLWEAKE